MSKWGCHVFSHNLGSDIVFETKNWLYVVYSNNCCPNIVISDSNCTNTIFPSNYCRLIEFTGENCIIHLFGDWIMWIYCIAVQKFSGAWNSFTISRFRYKYLLQNSIAKIIIQSISSSLSILVIPLLHLLLLTGIVLICLCYSLKGRGPSWKSRSGLEFWKQIMKLITWLYLDLLSTVNQHNSQFNSCFEHTPRTTYPLPVHHWRQDDESGDGQVTSLSVYRWHMDPPRRCDRLQMTRR